MQIPAEQKNQVKKDISIISDDLLTKALDASLSGVIITDNQLPDNPIIYCNKSFELMTGYQRKEIIGRNCRFLQRDDRHQPERTIIREAVKQGKACTIEIRNYRKDGSLFWNELYVSPVKDEHGHILYFIGVQNDVSRRKKAEVELRVQQQNLEAKIAERTKSLRENEEYLASIVQTIRESLIVLSPDLTVLSINEHFIRTFKVSRAETIGNKLYQLGNGQWNIQKLKDLLEQVLPTNNPVIDFEVDHTFPHIGRKLMLLNAYRVELEGTYKDRILMAIEDITDKRAIEIRKDDFLSIASHELKTPLTTVKGYVQMMSKLMPSTADEKLVTVLQKTLTAVNRLHILISELLDVSKIQSGKMALYRAPFDFDKMVHDAIDAIQATSVKHKIVVAGETNAVIEGDEGHILQVVNNLVSNAIKYSPESNEIRIYLAKVSNYVKFSITDFGIGLMQEDHKKIFDRFYRVDNIQTRFPGMGIGLYICDQIIKSHGGTLWVESELGHGSTFSFTLPLN